MKDSAAVLGEIVTMRAGAGPHSVATVRAALKAAGLSDELAKDLSPRAAFTRAAKALKENRVIDRVADQGRNLLFQLTHRSKGQSMDGKPIVDYVFETQLSLDKESGVVTCPIPSLAADAQRAINEAIDTRTASDVTAIAHDVFSGSADLFAVPDARGAYLVLREHAAVTAKVDTFLRALGGRVNRFPVPSDAKDEGTAAQSVRDCVAQGLEALIREHEAAVAEFSADTRDSTMARAAEKIKATRFKIDCYKQYLEEKADELMAALDSAKEALKAKIDARLEAAAETVAYEVACDHCGHTQEIPVPDDVEGAAQVACASCGQTFTVEFEIETETVKAAG